MRTILLAALATLVGACMMSSGSENMHDGMRDALSEAQDEGQRHATESRAAADLPSLILEVDRHRMRMQGIVDDMHGQMSSMEHCAEMGTMMNMHDGMEVEVHDHQTRMHAMQDLVMARAEEEHHMTVMNGMMDEMDMQLDGMHCSDM